MQCIFIVRKVRYDTTVRGNGASKGGENLAGDFLAFGNRRMFEATKKRTLLPAQNKFPHLIDGKNTAEVAVALSCSPGKESVAAKENSVRARIVPDSLFDQQSKFKSRSLPGNPDNLAIEFLVEFGEAPFSVRACGKSDGPVRMQMVYVRKGQEGV